MPRKKKVPDRREKAGLPPTVRDDKGRFVKGSSGNPAGNIPRGQSWQETIKRITNMDKAQLHEYVGKNTKLGRILEELPEGIPVKDAMVLIGIIQFGRDPEARMLSVLMDREEGKPKQSLDLGGTVSIDGLQAQLEKVYGNDSTTE